MAFDSKNGHGRLDFVLVRVLGGDSGRLVLVPIQSRVGQTISTNDGQELLHVVVGPAARGGLGRRRRPLR